MNAVARQRVAVAFGGVLRTARDIVGLSQEQLAEAADIDRTYPSLLERGLRQPTLHMLLRLATAVEMDPGLMIAATAAALRVPEYDANVGLQARATTTEPRSQSTTRNGASTRWPGSAASK
jgi:transcriptional regulator with XRE-family HTH domain